MSISGYTYKAETYCPPCVLAALPTGEGEEFDGWQDMSIPPMSPEDNLNELAFAFGIDRDDETSFDSDEFPKVMHAWQIDGYALCGGCGVYFD